MQKPHIVSGRVFPEALIAHIQEFCQSEPRPSSNALAREVCQQLGWRSPNGKWALSSCKVALHKLHKRGLIDRPAAVRASPCGSRRLRRSGKALPALGRLPQRVDLIPRLHLHLLSGAEDPLSLLWNDLMIAQHPCADAPLVGTQLRYLIGSDLGWLGALGFGPAAWVLGARDEWIGWSVEARKSNVSRVVGLSRLLMQGRLSVYCSSRPPNHAGTLAPSACPSHGGAPGQRRGRAPAPGHHFA